VIRGGIYAVDFGAAKRGHEQRGKRYGIVMSPSRSLLSVVTIIPTSTAAQPALQRPEIEFDGRKTRVLVDQIRSIDVTYIGEFHGLVSRIEMLEIEMALAQYLGLVPLPE